MKFIIAVLCLFIISLTQAYENVNCATTRKEEEFCAAHTYKIVKPLLEHLSQMRKETDKHRAQTESKEKELGELREEVRLMQNRFSSSFTKVDIESFIKQTLDLETITFNKLIKEEFSKWFLTLKNEMEQIAKVKEQTNQSEQKQLDSDSLKLKECEFNLKSLNATNIIKQEINQSDFFSTYKKTKGANWILIQQRLDDTVNFFRNWVTYRNGFGSYEHGYFLGLEKIHKWTNDKRYELYIELEKFNGEVTYAIYDHFVIGSEQEQYRLNSLGAFSGNETNDQLTFHLNQKFYTFERDTPHRCANIHKAGWWYSTKFCANSNLNGKYFKIPKIDKTSIFWHSHHALKRVQMLIRPRNDLN